ncbi:MAG TPA: class I SAM-dependent methyltransferase [Blastocatellia bacterium]|nr:class I SAM-dependent methyltransferase [Blastocatellia bacterium]
MQNSYDQIAQQWHSHIRGKAYIDRLLRYVDLALEGLQSGARVLDLGCGTGQPVARYLVEKGFRVTGVDQSEKMLEIAKQEVPEAEFIHSDMINVQLAPGFGAAIAWDSIFHVERKHHSGIFQRVANALEPGGRLLLSVGGSDAASTAEEFAATYDAAAEGFTSEMFGHTFFYSGYQPRVTRGLLEAAGFEIEVWEVDDPSSRGHIAVIAKKSA